MRDGAAGAVAIVTVMGLVREAVPHPTLGHGQEVNQAGGVPPPLRTVCPEPFPGRPSREEK